MKKSKLLSVLLCAAMVMTVCAAMGGAAFAAGPSVIGSGTCGKNGNNLTWKLTDDGVVTISGQGAMADYDEFYQFDENHNYTYDANGDIIRIQNPIAPWMQVQPTYIDTVLQTMGYNSQADAQTAMNNNTFDMDRYAALCYAASQYETHKVVIEEGVTTVGANAFKDWNVTEVSLPSSLEEIGYYAFNQNDFTSVTLPEGLTYIEQYAFQWCNNLESIVIPASVTAMGSYAIGGYRLSDITVLNPALSAYYSGSICVLGATGNSFPFADYNAYAFYKEVKSLVREYLNAKYAYPRFVQQYSSVIQQQLSQDPNYTSQQIADILNQFQAQYIQQLRLELMDPFIDTFADAVAVCCNRANALFGANLPEADLFELVPAQQTSGSTMPTARLAATADALLTARVGSDYGTLSAISSIRENSLEAYRSSSPGREYTHAPWVTLRGYCGSGFEGRFGNVFTFEKLHDFTNADITTNATCTADGLKTLYCPVCEQNYTEIIPANGHSWSEWTVTAPATYFAAGIKTRTCADCPASETEAIPMLTPDATADDADTGISVSFTDNAYEGEVTVSVSQVYDGASYELTNNEIGNYRHALFDITTLVDGSEAQPAAPVLVRIPVPEDFSADHITVYHVTENGLEAVPCVVENGYVCFEASHFSVYAVADESAPLQAEPDQPGTPAGPDTPAQPGNGGDQGGAGSDVNVWAKIAAFFQKLVQFFQNLFKK